MTLRSGKVLLYSINFAPELTGIGKYNAEMVRWLTARGYQVRVVTAPPYYPQWKVAEGYKAGRYFRERWHGADLWRCPIWVPKRLTGAKRLLHLFSFALSSLPVLILQMFWRPNVCFVVEPPLAASPMALLLARLFRVRAWLHVQDFEVDAAFELGLLPHNRRLKRIIGWLESVMMRSFHIVSTISDPMMRRLLDKKVRADRVRYFPNWVDLASIYPLATGNATNLRAEIGCSPEDIVALYAGNMGEKQGLDVALDAAAKLQEDSPVRIVLCGDGSDRKRLMERARCLRLANVHFLPLQPERRLNELLNTADIHLLVQKHKSSDLVMPSKLGGMLASGKCVLATAKPGTAIHTVMEASGAGVLVEPGNADELAGALRKLAQDRSYRLAAGQCARRYAERELGYEAVMATVQDVLTELGVRRSRESNGEPYTVESI